LKNGYKLISISLVLLLLIVSELACNKTNTNETTVPPTLPTEEIMNTSETAEPPTLPEIDIIPPVINITSISGTNPTDRELIIKANIDWLVSPSDSILLISPKSGSANRETQVTIAFNNLELTAGSYEYSIDITGETGELLQSVPIKIEVISIQVDKILNIEVKPEKGGYLAEGILLNEITVITSSLDRPIFSPQNREHYYAGDPCILIIGEAINSTTEDSYVDLFADGFDTNGNQVCWTISSGTIMGHVQTYVPSGKSNIFQLTLNWAENVQLIDVHASVYDRMIPSAP
jgi:hypothetical protein